MLTESPSITCEQIVDAIIKDQFREDELARISFCIGVKMSAPISRDAFENKKVYSSDTFFEDFKLNYRNITGIK